MPNFAKDFYSLALSMFLEISPFGFSLSWVRISLISFLENAVIFLYILYKVLFQIFSFYFKDAGFFVSFPILIELFMVLGDVRFENEG